MEEQHQHQQQQQLVGEDLLLTNQQTMQETAALHNQHFLQAQQMQVLQNFWQRQMTEIEEMKSFKEKSGLPLARIKKIMKFDEDVQMIRLLLFLKINLIKPTLRKKKKNKKTKFLNSSEAPALFAKACEFFIIELTLRAFFHTEENKRRTLQVFFKKLKKNY